MTALREFISELIERRELAAKKYMDEPLPSTDKEARLRLDREIAEHDLGQYVTELETRGFAVLPPGRGAPADLVDRLRDMLLRLHDERWSRPPEDDTMIGMAKNMGIGKLLMNVLALDPVFEEAVTNPVPLTLVTYLLGYRARLFEVDGIVKTNESDVPLAFHADHGNKFPPPWSPIPMMSNLTYVLTDYTRENGALCVVPGSHLWGRPPGPEFLMAHDHEDVELVEVPAGSVIVWHGSLWHGAIPRTAEGTRATFIAPFTRPSASPRVDYALTTTREMIERNPARFSVMTGILADNPWWLPSTFQPTPGWDGPLRDDLFSVAGARELGRWT